MCYSARMMMRQTYSLYIHIINTHPISLTRIKFSATHMYASSSNISNKTGFQFSAHHGTFSYICCYFFFFRFSLLFHLLLFLCFFAYAATWNISPLNFTRFSCTAHNHHIYMYVYNNELVQLIPIDFQIYVVKHYILWVVKHFVFCISYILTILLI